MSSLRQITGLRKATASPNPSSCAALPPCPVSKHSAGCSWQVTWGESRIPLRHEFAVGEDHLANFNRLQEAKRSRSCPLSRSERLRSLDGPLARLGLLCGPRKGASRKSTSCIAEQSVGRRAETTKPGTNDHHPVLDHGKVGFKTKPVRVKCNLFGILGP